MDQRPELSRSGRHPGGRRRAFSLGLDERTRSDHEVRVDLAGIVHVQHDDINLSSRSYPHPFGRGNRSFGEQDGSVESSGELTCHQERAIEAAMLRGELVGTQDDKKLKGEVAMLPHALDDDSGQGRYDTVELLGGGIRGSGIRGRECGKLLGGVCHDHHLSRHAKS